MDTPRRRALIVVESRHGSTLAIAGALAQRLVVHDFRVDVAEPKSAPAIDADVVVVGSAIYLGKWLRPAVRFLDAHAARLRALPVWLFSSGPLHDEGSVGADGPGIDAGYIEGLVERIGARGHRVFAGKLDRDSLGPIESWLVSAVAAPEGDFRNWPHVHEWADEIASSVQAELQPR